MNFYQVRLAGIAVIFFLLLSTTNLLFHSPEWDVPILGDLEENTACKQSVCTIPTTSSKLPTTFPIYTRDSSERKWIALTFDDGPDDRFTPKILNILRREKVQATFFVSGKQIRKNPTVLKRIAREGHLLGNHFENHQDLRKIPTEAVIQELRETDRLVYELTKKRMGLVRPPFGAMDTRIKQIAANHGTKMVFWSVDPKDWTGRTSEQIIRDIKKKTRAGDIILLHAAGGWDSLHGTVSALPEIIRYYKNKGYRFVTVDQLLQIPGYLTK
ncbi:polysaccharide deacetylase family protein [Risungbinella massiliensis]|uniref:polysaccharide deacetylase family protein n=1 Tax=Risungbinella massiliensis TaxID=1329796 RepID=UPI00069C00CE|nr:polysaccharide deacetylase family protein [Risungbinella massiliensis]